MANPIKTVRVAVDPGVAVNLTRRKGNTSKQILLTVNKDTDLQVSTIAPAVDTRIAATESRDVCALLAKTERPLTVSYQLRELPDSCAITGTVGTAQGNWAERSANRLMAVALQSPDPSDANLAGRHPFAQKGIWVGSGTYTLPVIDEFGLRFDVKTGEGIPDWYTHLNNAYGENSVLYAQWQWRMNQVFHDTVFLMAGGGPPGIKLLILSLFAASSTWNKLVVSTLDQHKFPYIYSYDENGNTANYHTSVGGGVDIDFEPVVGRAPTCLRTNWITSNDNGNGWGSDTPGCLNLVPNEWITFDLEVVTGSQIPGHNTWHCRRKLWATMGGVKTLVVDFDDILSAGGYGRNAEAFNGIWLGPYMTNRSGTQTFPNGTPSVWYRHVIFDDKPIPAPTGDGDVQPTLPQTIDQFTANQTSIITGGSATLSWQTSLATEVRLKTGSAAAVPVAADGSQAVSPASTTDYRLEADGSVPTVLSPTITITVNPLDPSLPSWVPPVGTFAEITSNVPNDLGVFTAAIFANYVGGTFIEDFSAYGAQALHGGGEHFTHPDKGGVLVLNLETRMYEARCVPTIQSHMQNDGVAGSLTNQWGAYADDDTPQSTHTYMCLQQMLAAWGGGSRGSLVRIAHSGGNVTATGVDGISSTYRFDLAQARDGISRLTGTQTYDFGAGPGATVDDASCTGIDYVRQGWWGYSREGNGWGNQLCFTHKSGLITPKATPAKAFLWGTIHHFADNDTLCVIADQIALHQIGSTGAAAWKNITNFTYGSQAANDLFNFSFSRLGYIGFKWSTLLGCFCGFDHSFPTWPGGNPGPNTTVRVWKLTPPPMATRLTAAWHVELVTLTSNDGSVINPNTDQATLNGSMGKLVEAPKLKSFVWSRGPAQKGQLLRLPGMV